MNVDACLRPESHPQGCRCGVWPLEGDVAWGRNEIALLPVDRGPHPGAGFDVVPSTSVGPLEHDDDAVLATGSRLCHACGSPWVATTVQVNAAGFPVAGLSGATTACADCGVPGPSLP